MRITSFVRRQLIIFSIVAVISLIAVSLFYIRVPAMFGIGRYSVSVLLPSTGGIYQNANVTYRGYNIGEVESVALTSTGVKATLSLDSDAKVPKDSATSVQSVSAVGEQYIQFTPSPDSDGGPYLEDGSVVRDASVPVEVSSLLRQADRLIESIQSSKLRQVVDEAFTAFGGQGEELQRLLDSLTLFADEANKNSPQVVALVQQAAPLLETQTRTTAQIRQWTANVAAVTDQLRANDPQLRSVLDNGPGTTQSADELFTSMNQTLPLLFDNLRTTARTGALYLPNIRQVLVYYPRVTQALVVALNNGDLRHGAKANFALGLQDPGVCSVGYIPINQRRPGSAQTPQQLPPGQLCRVPQDSNVAVRGARNFPCVEFPGRRAPTPEECRTGYKPIAENVPFPYGLFGIPGIPNGQLTDATPSSFDSSASVNGASYSPGSDSVIGPGGQNYVVPTGGTKESGDADTWQSLITGAVK